MEVEHPSDSEGQQAQQPQYQNDQDSVDIRHFYLQ